MEGCGFVLWNVGYTLSQSLKLVHLRQGLQCRCAFLVNLATMGTKFQHSCSAVLRCTEAGLELGQVVAVAVP